MRWIDAVNGAKDAQRWLPYGRSGPSSDVVEGATIQVDWRGVGILRAGDAVSCVYTVMETLLTAAKMMGVEGEISSEDIEELKRWCFVYAIPKHRRGIAGGLEEVGLGYQVPTDEAQPGDVAQIWDVVEGRDVFGHCVFIMGREADTSTPAFSTWSAEPNKGNVMDWRYITHPNASKKREWYVGRVDF